MSTQTKVKTQVQVSMFTLLDDIVDDITWSEVAERYFPNKSISWFYNKLRGVDGNGGVGQFSLAEKIQLSNALSDLSKRLQHAAALVRAEV